MTTEQLDAGNDVVHKIVWLQELLAAKNFLNPGVYRFLSDKEAEEIDTKIKENLNKKIDHFKNELEKL